ncbi:MAG TPA: LysM peptidoglycan-binding domain-containing protein [Clostridiales bacterium]|nr:LysM peptidoglycan-binding domain-containing protein [Clostridiales bacterium]
MDIYVVQPGDTIISIAEKFGVSLYQLIQDNGLGNSFHLANGQAIVIVYPTRTHIVEEGDSLQSIAEAYNTTLLQLLRNNSFLSDREYIYPGETLVISYDTRGKLITNGYAYPFINQGSLMKVLPYLTYLSIFNYRIMDAGEVTKYNDDTQLIQTAITFGTIPLLMISAMSPLGESDAEVVYKLLINEEFQTHLISNILEILRSTDYHGVNIMISTMNEVNQELYFTFLTRFSDQLSQEGYLIFYTVNPNLRYEDNEIKFERIDYLRISQKINGFTFFQYAWGKKTDPPSPVSSAELINAFLEYIVTVIPAELVSVGEPLIGYDWELPFIPNRSSVNSVTINTAIKIAYDSAATIEFDPISQTPFFTYQFSFSAKPIDHIVWFIDPRSINALNGLIDKYGLQGSGIWNIMIYYQPLWTILNSQYELVKMIPDRIV